jgi:hypothetical protein
MVNLNIPQLRMVPLCEELRSTGIETEQETGDSVLTRTRARLEKRLGNEDDAGALGTTDSKLRLGAEHSI